MLKGRMLLGVDSSIDSERKVSVGIIKGGPAVELTRFWCVGGPNVVVE